jgi:Undecaprenyl-phosphate galactose phosphotransferase WbaP
MARRDELASAQIKIVDAPPPVPLPDDPIQQKLASILQQIESMSDEVPPPLPRLDTVAKKSFNLLNLFVVTDFLALVLGFIVAWRISAVVNTFFFARDLDGPDTAYGMLAVQFAALSAGMMLWFARTGHYRTRMPFWMETRKIVEVGGFAMLINCFLQIVSKQDFSRIWFLSAWVFSIAVLIAFRALVRKGLRQFKVWSVPTLIIGDGKSAMETNSVLGAEKNLGYEIVAQIKDLPGAFKQAGSSWAALCRNHQAEHIVVALEGQDYAHAGYVCAQLARERVNFTVVQPTHNLSVIGMTPQFFLGQEVMLMSCNDGLDNPLARILKRGFDIVFSLSALVAASPVILLLAFIVKRDGGPALYRHKRIGLNGKVFHCLKLRSMVANSNEILDKYLAENPDARDEWLRDHKLRNDPRITRIGAFMRRLSLDELPQLLNVLCGEMSIVGPRPIIVAEAAKYDNDITFYYRVRPGITGLWQVSGRNDVTYAERVRMDSWYVRNWSLWNDIAIICKTFNVVAKGSGAY